MEKLSVVWLPKRRLGKYIVVRVERMCEKLSGCYNISQSCRPTYQTLNQKGDTEEFSLRSCTIIEHEDKTFKVIDWGDRDSAGKSASKDIVKSPLCQFVLKSQYNSHKTIHPKVRPFFYFEKANLSLEIDRLREIPKETNKIYWRGNNRFGRKEVLAQLAGLLNEDHQNQVGFKQFCEEMACHKIAISLPGLGRACHREFEAFAIGTPVIMPQYYNTYYKDLIPNVHYIAVKSPPDLIQKRPAQLGQLIRERREEITDDLLTYVRLNAMKYYDTYIRYEPSVNWMIRLLELNRNSKWL